jgi:PAS domain S-box-containing protein
VPARSSRPPNAGWLTGRWRDLPLHSKTLVVIGVPILALLLSVLAAYLLERQQHESERAVQEMLQDRAHVLSMYVALLDAETGVRGYLLTHDDAFLAPYRQAERTVPPAVHLLDYAGAPAQHERAQRLQALVDTRFQTWQQLLAAAAADPRADLSPLIERGKAIMDAVRADLAEILNEEGRTIADQMARRDQVRVRTHGIVIASVVAGTGGGVFAAWLFVSSVVRRTRQLERNARRLAEGQAIDTTEEPAYDEIGRLEGTLRRAGALLLDRERALRRAAEEIRDLYERAPCGYHSIGADGTLLWMNATELEWLGYGPEEVSGRRKFIDMLTPQSQVTFAQHFPIFKAGGELRDVEFDMVRKDGSILPVSISASAVRDGDGALVASRSTVFDITRRRQVQEEVATLNWELQRRLVEQEALNRELEAFSYSVSHDLRSPLRTIDGFSQALLEDYGDRLDEQGHHLIARVRTAAQRMGSLIDDLLALARVTRADVHRTHVDVTAMATEIAGALSEQEPQRRVDWQIAPRIQVTGDPHLIHAALANLLGNAWKFTSRRDVSVITVQALAAGDGESGFAVHDNGAGFDMAHADKLFGAFQRLHGAAEFPGSGIGLATVQRIVHKHGGRLWADAVPDAGASFFLVLPVRFDRAHM